MYGYGLRPAPMAPKATRAACLPRTHRLTAAKCSPSPTRESAIPICRYNSRVRACTTSAREVVPGSAALSTMRTRTPRRWSQSARTRPVGPAPAIRTSVSDMAWSASLFRALNSLLGSRMRAEVLKQRIRLFFRILAQTQSTHQVGERLGRLAVTFQHRERVVVGLRLELP